MADGGASSSSQQKKPSKMALVEYFSFIKRNKKLKTVTDRDNQMESLEAMAEDVRSGDPDKQLEATSLFRNILQIYPNPPFQQVIQARVLPHFVQFLDLHFFPSLQVEAVFILGMFVKSSEHMNILVYHSAVPGLVNLIDSAHKITRKAVMFTLARIARNSPQLLERVLYYKGLKRLLVQFEENDLEFMLPVAAQALYLICSRGNPPLNPKMTSRFFSALQQLLQSSNEEVVADACWIFHYLSYARIGDVNAPLMLGVCSKLVEILDRTSPTIILPASMTVANIVGSDEVLDQWEAVEMFAFLAELSECSTLLANHAVVPAIVKLIQSPEDMSRTRVQAFFILGNISEKSPQISALVLRSGALEQLIAQFTADNRIENLRHASWVLRQICNPKPQMTAMMVNQVLHVLQLNLQSMDTEILVSTTWALASIPNQVLSNAVGIKLVELLSFFIRTSLRRQIDPMVVSHTALMAVCLNGILLLGSETKVGGASTPQYALKFVNIFDCVFVATTGTKGLCQRVMERLPISYAEYRAKGGNLDNMETVARFVAWVVSDHLPWNYFETHIYYLELLLVGAIGDDHATFSISRHGDRFYPSRFGDPIVTLGSGKDAMDAFRTTHPFQQFTEPTNGVSFEEKAQDYVFQAIQHATEMDEENCGGSIIVISILNGAYRIKIWDKNPLFGYYLR